MRYVVAALAAVSLAAAPAHAAAQPKVDQKCAATTAVKGVSSGRYSQSFTPKQKSSRRVEVTLMTTTDQDLIVRARIIGQRKIDDDHVIQINWLQEQQISAKFKAHQPKVLTMNLSPTQVWDGGAFVNQFAIEIALPPNDTSVMWMGCKPYAGGASYMDSDFGDAINRDTQRGLETTLPGDLAVTVYGP
jgi:hypothetical protein